MQENSMPKLREVIRSPKQIFIVKELYVGDAPLQRYRPWIRLEIKQNHSRIQGKEKKSCISYLFRASVQTYGQLSWYTDDWGNGGPKTNIYCEATACRRCILAALSTVNVGLTKVGNQAKPLTYSGKRKEKKKKSCISYLFRAGVQTYGHRPW